LTAEDHPHQLSGKALKQAFILTVGILTVEAGAGYLAHSLALLSDAGHILTDAVALGLAWLALEQAKRPADPRRTYGYHRVGILAAMTNGVTLILIVLGIGYEATRRLAHPEPVQGGLVIASAMAAIAVNSFIVFRLRHSGMSLNVRAAFLHVLGDLAASVGVLLAGIIIFLTGWLPIDPLTSIAIAILIAWGAVRIVIDTVNILLEGAPRGLDVDRVREEIESTDGVESVHDLHVWALSPEQVALSCHVVITEQLMTDAEHLMRGLEERLCQRFSIAHTTIQLEACHPCAEGDDHAVGSHNHPHVSSHPGTGVPVQPAHPH
jgi:cobalt-zinc-cadmium efflux system protein